MVVNVRIVVLTGLLLAATFLSGCTGGDGDGFLGIGRDRGETPADDDTPVQGLRLAELEACEAVYPDGGNVTIPCTNEVNELSINDGRPGLPEAICVYNSGFNSLARPLYLMYMDPVGDRVAVYWDLELEGNVTPVNGLFYMETDDGLVTHSWSGAGSQGHVWFPWPGDGIFNMRLQQLHLTSDTPALQDAVARPHWSFHNDGLYPLLEVEASGTSYWINGNVTVDEDAEPFFRYKVANTMLNGEDFDLFIRGERLIENAGNLNRLPLADCTLEDLQG